MISRVVTIGGPAGSGKTTVARRIAGTLGLEHRSAGELFRAQAAKLHMDLAGFSKFAEEHGEVDKTLDETMVQLAAPGRLLEGRLTGALLRQRGVDAILLAVTASREVRIDRLAERDRVTREEAAAALAAREASEGLRYMELYEIDLRYAPTDFTVDSSEIPAEAAADRLLEYLREHAS